MLGRQPVAVSVEQFSGSEFAYTVGSNPGPLRVVFKV